MSITDCDCPQAGWCPRHGCEKPPWAWELCQTNPVLFQVWETGQPPVSTPDSSPTGPGLLQRTANFGTALVRHAVGGFQEVRPEVATARLALCYACPACDLATQVCREQRCGCYLPLKTKWATEFCPQGKWGAVTE